MPKIKIESITNKYGTLKNFFNCTAKKYKDKDIDVGILYFIDKLNNNGLDTVLSCSGHNKSNAYVIFATYVNKLEVINTLNGLGYLESWYKIEKFTNKLGIEAVKIVIQNEYKERFKIE